MKIFVCVIVFCWMNSCSAQSIRNDIDQIIKESKVPGLSLAYVEVGVLKEHIEAGVRDNESKTAVDQQTVFAAASLSKSIFAYAVMQLVSAGKLDLDMPLSSYYLYPDLQHDKKRDKVTARMVLSHTSGLPNWRRRNDTLRFSGEPGKSYRYSGEGYVFLSRVVEKITGMEMEAWMKQTVFDPLGMTRSSYIWQKSFEPDFAKPHDKEADVQENYFPPSPNMAHSLQTTAEDYAKFLIAMLNGSGIDHAVFKTMFDPQPNSRMEEDNNALFWSLGFGCQQTKDGTAIWQWGDNENFKCFFIAYPAKKQAIAYFTNSYNGLAIVDKILALFVPEKQPVISWLKKEY